MVFFSLPRLPFSLANDGRGVPYARTYVCAYATHTCTPELEAARSSKAGIIQNAGGTHCVDRDETRSRDS